MKDRINVEKDSRNMLILKNLKDLAFDGNRYEHKVNVAKLRAEAIKWVKEKGQYRMLGYNKIYVGEVVVWIKHFFNLTSEDLK